MIGQLRNSWQQFKESEPGSRFQDRYHRRSDNSNTSRVLTLLVGVVLVAVGLASMPFPIPADGFLAPLGLILIASEIEPFARFLDWAEVQAREALQRASILWKKASAVVRFLIVAAGVLAVVVLGYGAYSLFFGG